MLCEAILGYLLRVARTVADRSTIYGKFEIELPVYSMRSLRQPASSSAGIYCRIKSFEFDTSIVSGETPVDRICTIVASMLPGRDLVNQG